MSRPPDPGALSDLMDEAGPVIRYRVARELLEDRALAASCEPALLAAPATRRWLDRLARAVPAAAAVRRYARPGAVDPLPLHVAHGGGDAKLETVLGKLVFLGLHAGIPAFDERVAPLRTWLRARARDERARPHPFGSFTRTMLASQLALAGYAGAPEVAAALRDRAGAIYPFAKRRSLDIYVEWAPPHRPNAFHRRRRLIDPRLYGSRGFALPWHHDLHLFGAVPERRRRASVKIRAIAELVLRPEFQALDPSYGMIALAKDRFMVSGWRPRLPGYDGRFEAAPAGIVAALLMMAPFEPAREHRWLRGALEHLRSFTDEGGRVCFPLAYLTEKPAAYWPWSRLQLEAGRRTLRTRRLESTFWLAKICKLARMA